MLSIAKLQNLKAIHNTNWADSWYTWVVINRKTTKFESNSQQSSRGMDVSFCCYQSQNYKIWKQFTTLATNKKKYILLLSIAKLQNLKAIHNWAEIEDLLDIVVINRKTTKFESNSQQVAPPFKTANCCYQSQNYKIWKQFTTLSTNFTIRALLLSIAKLQNLKAIHNK